MLNLSMTPVVIFAFNRPTHFKRTLEFLKLNKECKQTPLYVFIDGPRQDKKEEILVNEVIEIASTITGFKSIEIIKSEVNLGLANSIIKNLTKLFRSNDSLIVLEDDILVSKDFLSYMNQAIELYKNTDSIGSVSGYSYGVPSSFSKGEDLFMSSRISSWGWATWKKVWDKVDWNQTIELDNVSQRKLMEGGLDLSPMLKKQQKGVIDSWAIRWAFYHRINDLFCVCPFASKVKNIGTDGSGSNFTSSTNKYDTELSNKPIFFEENLLPQLEIINFLKLNNRLSLIRKIINRLKYGI